jgi:hypothetical protein
MGKTEADLLDALLGVLHRLPEIPEETASHKRRLDRAQRWRHEREEHSCALCGGRARFVLVAGPSPLFGEARWLDVCGSCNAAIGRLYENWPGDLAALQRYRYLQAEGVITTADV